MRYAKLPYRAGKYIMRQTLIRYGLLYKTLFIQRVKTLMEYRADFIIGAFSTIMRQSISVFFSLDSVSAYERHQGVVFQ